MKNGESQTCYKDESQEDIVDNNENIIDEGYDYVDNTINNNKAAKSNKNTEEVELITSNTLPLPQTQATQSNVNADSTQTKQIKTSFSQSSTYMALLISGFVLLVGLIVFLTAVLIRMF